MSTRELHRWTDRQGQAWACGVYDHGPMCRRCQKVDGTLASILENVDMGRMEFVNAEADGELCFRLTEEGQRQATDLIRTDPEASRLAQRFNRENN